MLDEEKVLSREPAVGLAYALHELHILRTLLVSFGGLDDGGRPAGGYDGYSARDGAL